MNKEALASILEVACESTVKDFQSAYEAEKQVGQWPPELEQQIEALFSKLQAEEEKSADTELSAVHSKLGPSFGSDAPGDPKIEVEGDSPSEALAGKAAKAPTQENPSWSDREEVYRLFNDYLTEHHVSVRFDGYCDSDLGPKRASKPDEVDAVLMRDDIDEQWIIDEFLMHTKARGLKVRKSDAARAAKKAFTRAKLRHRRDLLKPLLMRPDPLEVEQARNEFGRLASIFDMEAELTAGIFAHYIWQVKQKQLNRPLVHHLMPVVVSSVQGSGKTTFVSRFLRPLQELATDPVLLEDFADMRNTDIYRYPSIFIDDVGSIPAKMVATLKSLITAEGLRRRKLGSSMSVGVKQRSTLIGTANHLIEQLIPDTTGHRRFVSLPFRNGASDKNGDPEVWATVATLNYSLLWRSVDAFAPSPILGVLPLLYAHQSSAAPDGEVRKWLAELDLEREDVLRITTRNGIKANDLYELYLRDKDSEMSSTQFGTQMKRHLAKSGCPFDRTHRDGKARYYVPKKGLGVTVHNQGATGSVQ